MFYRLTFTICRNTMRREANRVIIRWYKALKINVTTNEQIQENLVKFPDYRIECNLATILEDRSFSMNDLSKVTGLRVGTISEIANMKRSTINIPHLIVIAQALRITDLTELYELKMSEETYDKFIQDKIEIELQGKLFEQVDYLKALKTQKKPTV